MIVCIGGTEIYYEQHGSGAPLLLLHGWGCDVSIFEAIVRDFAPFRQVTVIDFPGHGKSPEPPEPWSVTEYTELTAELIRKLGLERPDIIAHSFGGRVSILLSATHPELVGKLLLTGCAGLISKASGKLTAKTRVYKLLRTALDNGFTRGVLGEATVEKFRSALRNKFGSADYKALKTDRMRGTFNRVIAQDLEPYLKDIKAPTLLIYGDQDTATPLWMGQTMEREIKDSALITMTGAGHYAFLERYAEFRAIAYSFFKIEA